MPTVLRVGPYRFFFYSLEQGEPPHIHVHRDIAEAKFWLNPIRLARNRGFSEAERNRVEVLAVEHEATFQHAWNDYFGA